MKTSMIVLWPLILVPVLLVRGQVLDDSNHREGQVETNDEGKVGHDVAGSVCTKREE